MSMPNDEDLAFERALLGAGRAEGALERADAGVPRFRRQIAIAALAVRLQLQHQYVPGYRPPSMRKFCPVM